MRCNAVVLSDKVSGWWVKGTAFTLLGTALMVVMSALDVLLEFVPGGCVKSL